MTALKLELSGPTSPRCQMPIPAIAIRPSGGVQGGLELKLPGGNSKDNPYTCCSLRNRLDGTGHARHPAVRA